MSLELNKRAERVTEPPSPQDKSILISDAYILKENLHPNRKYVKKKYQKRKFKFRNTYVYQYTKMFLFLTAGNVRVLSK